MAKPPFTSGEKRILHEARRRVTLAEKIASRGRFSLGGSYYVPATVKKITPRTPFLTVSRVKDYFSGVSQGTATAQRKADERAYTSAAAEAQAEKQIETKAKAESKIARSKRAKRNARRQKAAKKDGFARGNRQREAVIRFLNDAHKRHDRYLATNQDEYVRSCICPMNILAMTQEWNG